MKIIEKFLSGLEQKVDKDLIFKFFIVFSRFEYALKRAKYLKSNNNRVQPDWDVFALKLNRNLVQETSPEIKDAIDYFKNNPPKQQIVTPNGDLGWNIVGNTQQLNNKQLLEYIRRVRNNLFHGGKFQDGPVAEPARNEDLLKNSLIILNSCLEIDANVKFFFLDI